MEQLDTLNSQISFATDGSQYLTLTLRSMGRGPCPARKRSSSKRDYLRPILRFDKLTVPSSTQRLRPEGRKIEGQPGNLKASYPNRGADVQPYLRAGLRFT